MRHTLALICCVAVLPTNAPQAAAQEEDPERTAVDLLSPEAERSIEKGLKWLAGRQHENGSFGTREYGGNVAICGLALGVMILAMRLPPNEGAICTRRPLSSISRSIQSAVSPVPRSLAVLGAISWPKRVAPIRRISGLNSLASRVSKKL